VEQLLSYYVFGMAVAFGVHCVFFVAAVIWLGREKGRVKETLASVVHDFDDRPDVGGDADDQIAAFLDYLEELIETPKRRSELLSVHKRLAAKDQSRSHLKTKWLETLYNVCRELVAAWPMVGILGTVLAIGIALRSPGTGNASADALSGIVESFGTAIWSTVYGLVFAVGLLFFNACVEPSFNRLFEQQLALRNLIRQTKRISVLTASEEE